MNGERNSKLLEVVSKLELAEDATRRLYQAQEEERDSKWELLYALIQNDPHLAAGVCTVSRAKLRRALRNILKDDNI